MDSFKAVGDFHRKFGLPTADDTAPNLGDHDTVRFRAAFMLEELAETCEAMGLTHLAPRLMDLSKTLIDLRYDTIRIVDPAAQDITKVADGLGDLKYVTDGTAHFFGLPFDEVFSEIQRANMDKERTEDRSTHKLGMIKPAGWMPPDHAPAIANAIANHCRKIT